ncbi:MULTISPECIES: GGDEF domain-containing protein [unclassified Pseudomonas]|uniref:GGDEF domain-containing protein n=1 Tax=unclassified Pseudomonas TaxID=196821 RepID=UPI00027074D6|nr:MULTISPECIES: GGDEF domain-containing protein [unclassified Pseudomonas]EJM89837.1 diguanylate cyclase (GGDEF) domain-containing protein [Pseudomonas sp. GM67]MBD9545247.1 GGDEF domain-containing protein [Pseudomonas sp. PDM01]
MSNFDLRESIESLAERAKGHDSYLAEKALVAQFNHLLSAAKLNFPERIDLNALPEVWEYSEHKILARSISHLLDATKFLAQQGLVRYGKFEILRAESQLAQDFQALANSGKPVGLVFFDIDHFKDLNTKYTETTVDLQVLKPFMRFVKDLVQARGYSYSVGGDEFIVLLGNTSALETEAFANRLLDEAAACRFDVDGSEVSITLSTGTCSSHPGNLSVDEVRKKANEAENSAKKKGRNRVERSGQ